MNPVGSTTQNCGESLRADYEEVAGAKRKITDTIANKKQYTLKNALYCLSFFC